MSCSERATGREAKKRQSDGGKYPAKVDALRSDGQLTVSAEIKAITVYSITPAIHPSDLTIPENSLSPLHANIKLVEL